MHKYKCPKCGQQFSTELKLKEAPICARQDRKVTHPVKMVPLLIPQKA
jgi:hypothetical protein